MLKCPECSAELTPSLSEEGDDTTEYVEVEFACPNNHSYFTRITADELIEEE